MTREQIAADLAEFFASGRQVERVPGFTEVAPRRPHQAKPIGQIIDNPNRGRPAHLQRLDRERDKTKARWIRPYLDATEPGWEGTTFELIALAGTDQSAMGVGQKLERSGFFTPVGRRRPRGSKTYHTIWRRL